MFCLFKNVFRDSFSNFQQAHAGFYTKLNVWGSLGLNFDYDGGPIIEMEVPSFYISFEFWKVVHPSVKGYEQALAVKQVSQNIKSF